MKRLSVLVMLLLPACGEEDVEDLRALEFLEQVGAPICPSTATRLVKTYYVNCYQDEWSVPRWVGYRISGPELVPPGPECVEDEECPQGFECNQGYLLCAPERSSSFREDPELPATTRSDNADYEAYYDRGHMAPAGDFLRSEQAMDETFYLSNIAPQEPIFNRETWADLEAAIRDTVEAVEVAWVYTGNLFLDADGQPTEPSVRIGRHGVAVPTHNWKALLTRSSGGSHQAHAYVLPNVYPAPTDWTTYNVPVDEVEGLTGLDFFTVLSDDIEDAIELSPNPLP